MLKPKISINQELLTRLRELPERAQRNIRRKIQTELQPELQQDVQALLGNAPGPVSSPFEFGSELSKRFFFFLIRSNPTLSDGEHWIRVGTIENAWRVTVSDRLRESLITLSNIQRESTGQKPFPARYVYAPWAVSGHIKTGWPELLRQVQDLIRTKAHNRIYRMWGDSIHEAAQGQG